MVKTPSKKKPQKTAKTPLLEAKKICKSFGDFTTNDDVDFVIEAGTIHALLGENGAGKSTFVKMLYGVQSPDQGQLIWNGQVVDITSPKAARAMGIAMVFQHFSLFPALSVVENIALALDDAPALGALSKRVTKKHLNAGGWPLTQRGLLVIYLLVNNSALKFCAVFYRTLNC